jgi:hypothetical protein
VITHDMTYVVHWEAWYAGRLGGTEKRQLTIGGTGWELTIGELDAGLRVDVYDDAWQAYTEAPDLFTGLAALASVRADLGGYTFEPTLDAIRALLDRLGARDNTRREHPDYPHATTEADRLRATAGALLKQADTLDQTKENT